MVPDRRLEGLCGSCLAGLAFGPSSLPASPVEQPAGLPFRVGDYELLEEVGRGGMGVVYRARQVGLDRTVAVKLLRDPWLAGPEELARFRVEAAAAAALRHPNIVAVYEVGEVDGRVYFSMEHVDGPDLATLTRGQPMEARRAADIGRRLAEALQHAHDRGVWHRDLKPSNVLLDAADEPRLADFGMARRAEGASELTVTGQVLGTPGYMAPEQARDSRSAGPWSDQYSLGAVLYHLVTGRAPFVGATPAEVLQQALAGDPLSPRLLNPGLPRDLETILLKALARDPRGRYPRMQEMGEDLGRFVRGEPIAARPLSPVGRLGRWGRRRPVLATVLASATALLVAGGVMFAVAGARIERQRRQAERVKEMLQDMLAAPDPNLSGKDVRVVDILARARRRLTNDFQADPLVRAEIESTLGATYYQLSLYEESEPLLRSAVTLFSRELGPEAARTGQARAALGSLLNWAGHEKEGFHELESGVEILRRHQPRERRPLAMALADLGSAYISVARGKEAAPPLREAIGLCTRLGASLDQTRAAALADLATAEWELGQSNWYRHLEESLEINRRLPDGRMNLATGLVNLADALADEAQWERAEVVAREALAIRAELFGTNSVPYAFALGRLASVLHSRTNEVVALELVERALAIQRSLLPEVHRDVHFALRIRGTVFQGLGRWAEAEADFRRSRELGAEIFGADHRTVHSLDCFLGEVLASQGRLDEARGLLDRAVPFLQKEFARLRVPLHQQQRLAHFEDLRRRLAVSAALPDGPPPAPLPAGKDFR